MRDRERYPLASLARSGLIATASLLVTIAGLYALYLWGYSAHVPGEAKQTEAHCYYAPSGEKRTEGITASQTGPLVICRQTTIESNSENSDAAPAQTGFVGLTHVVARKIVSDPVALFTLVLAGFTYGLIIVGTYQHRASVDALKLASEEFRATHRPRLRVRNINVKKIGAREVTGLLTTIEPGEMTNGQFYVSNVGASDAVIQDVYFLLYGNEGVLPMERPYEGREGNSIPWLSRVGPGQSTPVKFDCPAESAIFYRGQSDSPVAINALSGNVFAMGWVEYSDGHDRRYRTAFCRRYDPGVGRFVHLISSDVLDYEHEE